MNNTIISVGTGILLVVIVGSLVLWQKGPDSLPAPVDTTVGTAENTATTTDTSTMPATANGIESTEVATHNSRESCWTTINGNVYDLTSWIPQHPGGEQAILQLCGTDGSAKFNGKHGSAAKQAAILFGFKLGV